MQKSEGQPRRLAQEPQESMSAPQTDPTRPPGASTLTLQSHRGAAKALGENACPSTASVQPTSPRGAARHGNQLGQQAWAARAPNLAASTRKACPAPRQHSTLSLIYEPPSPSRVAFHGLFCLNSFTVCVSFIVSLLKSFLDL